MTKKSFINDIENGHTTWNGEKGLIRVSKKIIVDPNRSTFIDGVTVRKRYSNALSALNLPEDFRKIRLSIGVTSPIGGEGKTLIAANLAVSLALAHERKTVLVDMNMTNPGLHKTFGTKLRPGLVESFHNGKVFLSRTKIDKLYLLPAGRHEDFEFGLNSMIPIKDILHSLEQEFEIVIVDMSSVLPIEDFPVAFVSNLDGLLVVIDSRRTKYADVERMFKHINKDQAFGFVMNNMDE